MNLAPVELLLVAAIVCVLMLPILDVRNALQANESQWAAIGESRTMWLVLIIAGTLMGGSSACSCRPSTCSRPAASWPRPGSR